MNIRSLPSLLCWLLLCTAAGAIGAIASSNAPDFYQQLSRPDWAPPSTVFGPVWSTLYVLMGVAAQRVWRRREHAPVGAALVLFIAQLALNALWSWLFFAWRMGGAALADIALLWLLIGATIIAFWRIDRLASMLLWPYWLWVSFAAALNYSVWQRNPALLG